jgi:hypothetical protein
MPVTELQKTMIEIGQAMAHYTYPYLAQIFEVQSRNRGRFLGSGTFINLGGTPYLLTASHVPADCTVRKWAHSLGDATPPTIVPNPWQCLSFPEDLALARLDVENFAGQHRVRMLEPNLFANNCEDLNGDFIFLHGWPGELSKELWSLARGIASKTFPYTTCLGTSSRSWFDHGIHFAVDFRVEAQTQEGGGQANVPSPHGMSGSAVWKTNWNHYKKDWRPEHARVIGVAFDWDQSGHAITCTRIERVRDFINLSLHREAAYFNWQQRGGPYDDNWEDWFKVNSHTI